MKWWLSCALASLLGFSALGETSTRDKSKYGPEAALLSRSHEYIQKNPAPDYWALSPYYVGQQTDSACSLAVATMIVNAARAAEKLKASEELVTQPTLLRMNPIGCLTSFCSKP